MIGSKDNMKWIEVTINTSNEASDAICEKLIGLGSYGISVNNPFEIASIIYDDESLVYADEEFISSLGEDVFVRGYFAQVDKEIDLDEFLIKIEKIVSDVGQFLDVKKGEITAKYVDDEDWANSWKIYYKPLKISQRVVIVPSWESYTATNEEKIVTLDPKSAFGTGSHETTKMCAQFIDEYYLSDINLKGNALDLGCGSGILAIIAANLGAENIDAADIDDVAVKVCNENILTNNAQGKINCFNAQAKDLKENQYDLVIANIIADVLEDIAGDLKRILKPGGTLITGGIINHRSEGVEKSFEQIGFKLLDKKQENDWVSIKFSI